MLKRLTLLFTLVLILLGTATPGVAEELSEADQAICLAYTLDRVWSRKGHLQIGDKLEVAVAQAEAIARIKIKLWREAGTPMCKVDQIPWAMLRTWDATLGTEYGSARWQILYPISQKALRGEYAKPWPESYNCAVDFSATNWRIVSKARNFRKRRRAVGKIGTLVLYCD